MPAHSAGLVIHRRRSGTVEVLLVHPGGPYWANKDHGAWSIPKGEYEPGEDPLAAACRELREELGVDPPAGERVELGEIRQKGGKRVRAWAIEGDPDLSCIESNTVEIEWPPRSGRRQTFPEVDKAEWFALADAHLKILDGQRPLLDAVETLSRD